MEVLEKITFDEYASVLVLAEKLVLRFDTKKSIISVIYNPFKDLNIPLTFDGFPESILGKDFIIRECEDSMIKFFSDMKKGITNGSIEIGVERKDGISKWLQGKYNLIFDENGNLASSIIVFSDITEQKIQETFATIQRKEIDTLVDDCDFYLEGSVTKWFADRAQGHLFDISSFFKNSRIELNELITNNIIKCIYDDDIDIFSRIFSKKRLLDAYLQGNVKDSIDFRIMKNDKTLWLRMTIYLVGIEDMEIRFCALFNDISQKKKNMEVLVNRATVDTLTGLLTRGEIMKRIEDYLMYEGADGTHALVMIDLDNLKEINDTLGHQTGDSAIRYAANAMKSIIREEDFSGRVGGDEFFIFIKDISPDEVSKKVKFMLHEIQTVFSSDNKQVSLSASAGVVMYHGNADEKKTLEELYGEVDATLYRAKSMGKNTFIFSDEYDTLISSKSSAAIANNEAIAVNLRGLLNNFSNGVEIIHGKIGEKLVPVFCNRTLLRLLGLTQQEFIAGVKKDHFYGIHTDDRDEFKKVFLDAYNERKPFRTTFRLGKSDTEYSWVYCYGNITFLDDGSFDVYIIYSRAEHAVLEKRLNEERYKAFMQKSIRSFGEKQVSMHINLTHNECSQSYCSIGTLHPVETQSTVELFMESLIKNIASQNEIDEFMEKFDRKCMLDNFAEGILHSSMKLPVYMEDGDVMWFLYAVDIAQNPSNGDIEALVSVQNSDKEVRYDYVVKSLLEFEYEFIGQIDVSTEKMTIIGSDLKESMSVFDYTESINMALPQLVDEDFLERSLEATSLSKILRELENTDTYMCAFPSKIRSNDDPRLLQWKFRYIDKDRKFIMATERFMHLIT